MTWLGYDQGKTPASALLAATPFGMEPWEYSAWWYEAGGKELGSNLYKTHNIHPVYCGMTGPETAGWFKQEIKNTKTLIRLDLLESAAKSWRKWVHLSPCSPLGFQALKRRYRCV